ncbi:MAG: hypothetical protein EAZ91_24460 [Cytophagales bacterium]|nr:MAG: hypothetical protein EAZ91_24460 [Cytophagales bacterium]
MDEIQQAKWHRMQKRGRWIYLVERAALTALIFLVLDALLGSGYTLLLKQGQWIAYLQGVNWFGLLWKGFIVGFFLGLYTWDKTKKAFEQKHS